MKILKQSSRWLPALLLALALLLTGCGQISSQDGPTTQYTGGLLAGNTDSNNSSNTESIKLPEQDGYYYDLTNVVLYLETYDKLPPNYITKAEAKQLGWQGGTPEAFKEGAAIGGDRFSNREGLLPEAAGGYIECDLNTNGASERGAERLVFTNADDRLYYYTEDHYESFCQVVVEEGQVLFAEDDCGGDA